ncbi:hypothetical protein C8Q75DRAFT_774498 [Abortiporus biennis]|nr:hypothetical protein C8Q75DRAFT_774498 [Abortiporus biennis]
MHVGTVLMVLLDLPALEIAQFSDVLIPCSGYERWHSFPKLFASKIPLKNMEYLSFNSSSDILGAFHILDHLALPQTTSVCITWLQPVLPIHLSLILPVLITNLLSTQSTSHDSNSVSTLCFKRVEEIREGVDDKFDRLRDEGLVVTLSRPNFQEFDIEEVWCSSLDDDYHQYTLVCLPDPNITVDADPRTRLIGSFLAGLQPVAPTVTCLHLESAELSFDNWLKYLFNFRSVVSMTLGSGWDITATHLPQILSYNLDDKLALEGSNGVGITVTEPLAEKQTRIQDRIFFPKLQNLAVRGICIPEEVDEFLEPRR